MSIDSLIEFYDFTFQNADVQSELIETKGLNDFIEKAVSMGAKHGFYFSKEEMTKTISSHVNNAFVDGLRLESVWIEKVMRVGWVPKGYTR